MSSKVIWPYAMEIIKYGKCDRDDRDVSRGCLIQGGQRCTL